MTHTPHELAEEFPGKADRLHALKVSDPLFAELAERYHHVNREIHRMEALIEPASSEAMEDAKKLRLVLKDEIASRLG